MSEPTRFFRFDQVDEAESYAEQGGIAILEIRDGWRILGRRRLLTGWAMERGFGRQQLQLPTVTGVWHIDLVGELAVQVGLEYGIGVADVDAAGV